jgi:hypothetical protein
MSIFSLIRDILGIRKDHIETKKAKLEVKKLEEETRNRESIIQKADIEDVKKYDPKTKELLETIEIPEAKYKIRRRMYYRMDYAPLGRLGWLIWICLLIGLLIFLYFKFMK